MACPCPKINLVTLLQFCLKVFRFRGFLPFVWHSQPCHDAKTRRGGIAWHPKEGEEEESLSLPCCLRRRGSLVVWSWVFVVSLVAVRVATIVIHFAFSAVDAYDHLGDLESTFAITTLTVHLITLLLSTVLLLVLAWRGDQLALLLHVLGTTVVKHRTVGKGKMPLYPLLTMLVYLIMAGCSVIIVTIVVQETSTNGNDTHQNWIIYTQIMKTVISQLFFHLTVTVLVMLFHVIAAILSVSYANVLKTLPRSPDLIETALRDSPVNDLDVLESDGGGRTNSGSGSKAMSPSLNPPLTPRDIHTAACHLRELHHFQGLVNSYFNLPLFLCIANALMCIISYVFFCTHYFDHPVNPIRLANKIIIIILHCNTLVSIFTTPDCVLRERDRLREVILWQRMKETRDAEVAEKLNVLAAVMETYPGFSVGGLFVITKSKLVGLASFVATYLVILLQFHMSDHCTK
ncbi:uncharacterized protein LOC123512389 [Portunus trituberculatus]|uniref:uncharacterized protein LOC123512389 n=1 Tax=Portunus trituberculatus TaxID=210409 RepID=UPI001E1CBD52|nr:uncharacterized protein LOC123512389 [Portunus trituberculatus]